jgi:VIT1/CCC1 family predicted Fe2+/Mn2+ transporter
MAATWTAAKPEFKNRFDALNQADTDTKIATLNTAISKYVSKGGLNQDSATNPEYDTITTKLDELNKVKAAYHTLYQDLTQFLKTHTTENSLADALTKNGSLKVTVQQLTKTRDSMKTDVESAVAREELLRSRETDMTRHELFLFGRPIRRGMIPYLWLLSVIFIGVGLCVFYMTSQTLGLQNTMGNATFMGSLYYMLTDFFTNSTVLYAIIGSLVIVILAMALKIAGVFG